MRGLALGMEAGEVPCEKRCMRCTEGIDEYQDTENSARIVTLQLQHCI